MSAWLDDQDGRSFVTTIQDKESEHTKSEVKRAKEAWKLICNSGYSSEHDALGLVSDGNILGVPITAQDVRRAFEIYGKPAAHVSGRRTAHKPTKEERDVTLCANKDAPQSMFGDIMHMRGKQYFICLTLPLGLATVVPSKVYSLIA